VPYLENTSAVVLANHGLVAFGKSLEWAWFVTEIVDSYCRLLIAAQTLGEPKRLSDEQMAELMELKKNWSF
jgi:L-fuculose-phosphate aldolase